MRFFNSFLNFLWGKFFIFAGRSFHDFLAPTFHIQNFLDPFFSHQHPTPWYPSSRPIQKNLQPPTFPSPRPSNLSLEDSKNLGVYLQPFPPPLPHDPHGTNIHRTHSQSHHTSHSRLKTLALGLSGKHGPFMASHQWHSNGLCRLCNAQGPRLRGLQQSVNSKLLFIWDRNIQILRNCPAFFAQLYIAGAPGGSWGPPSKLCTRASENFATPLLT